MCQNISRYILDLLFPQLCSCCEQRLLQSEKCLCTNCIFHFPKTQYHLLPDNPVEELFWGRVEVERATSFLFFTKGSNYQKLIHQLKYKSNIQLGRVLGKHFAADLQNSTHFKNIDYIVPVPLHKRKEKQRGYNQSLIIAEGMSIVLNKPIVNDNLYRIIENPTQTRRSRYDRWKNVDGIFGIRDSEQFVHKHILLIDDVITTGSTLEAATWPLIKANASVSIATVGHVP